MGGGSEAPRRVAGRQLLLAVLPWPKDAAQRIIAEILDEFPELELHYIQEAYAKADRGKTEVPKEIYSRARVLATLAWLPPDAKEVPNLEFIQFYSAGTNHVATHPIYTDSKIPLCSANGVHGPQISEWVLMMDLVHSHNYIQLYEAQRKKDWDQKKGMLVKDTVGRNIGIAGYGSIGRQVARVFRAMGAGEILVSTASPRPTPESRKDGGFIVPGTGDPDGEFPTAWYSGLDKESLHEFLRQGVDLLVLSIPLTKDTTHFLSTEEFAILNEANPGGTYVVNVSRGGIIDQPALIKALESGQISGAALDVADPEPLPADDPLWDAPNVLITPHVSGSSVAYAERAFQVLQENLRRHRDGKALCNLVNRKRGY